MVAAQSHHADAIDGEDSFAQHAEELYETIAFQEDGIDSESVGSTKEPSPISPQHVPDKSDDVEADQIAAASSAASGSNLLKS